MSEAFWTVPLGREVGPIPKIPSKPNEPTFLKGSPMDWFVTVSEPNETVSVYS